MKDFNLIKQFIQMYALCECAVILQTINHYFMFFFFFFNLIKIKIF